MSATQQKRDRKEKSFIALFRWNFNSVPNSEGSVINYCCSSDIPNGLCSKELLLSDRWIMSLNYVSKSEEEYTLTPLIHCSKPKKADTKAKFSFLCCTKYGENFYASWFIYCFVALFLPKATRNESVWLQCSNWVVVSWDEKEVWNRGKIRAHDRGASP